MKKALFLLLLLGCGGEKPFPSSVGDSAYGNGHPVTVNEVDQDLAETEQKIVDLTNERRVNAGLAPLRRSPMLDALARGHSTHMPLHDFYAHVNPEGDGPMERLMRVARSGYIYENLWAVNDDETAAYIVEGFWNSPDHQANMLSATTTIGVGLHRRPRPGSPGELFITMEFLKD